DGLPEGPFDAVFMSHILHSSSYEECAYLVQKVAPVVSPGGEIIIQEFVLDEDKTEPLFATAFALNMLLHTQGGRTFSFREIRNWLEAAGFTDARERYLDLPNSGRLVVARKPG
ncbi:MAG: methyltransferase, partial [Acidobacteriota bacterium]